MKLYSYILARDFGFAPNPFYGWCTLATCKSLYRLKAEIGDWIIGTGAKTNYNFAGRLMYAMCVEEACDFDTYWNDPRFAAKKPVLSGSLKQLYGDNIYHKEHGTWKQEDSHHSLDNGMPNVKNLAKDTKVDRVLLSKKFVYFGDSAPNIPGIFRPFGQTKEEICAKGQEPKILSESLALAFESWLNKFGKWGIHGLPLEFRKHRKSTEG